MSMRRVGIAVSVAAVVALGACSSSQPDSSSRGAKDQDATESPISVGVQPEGKGAQLIDAINNATSTVDVVVYTIGGDPDFDGALKAAKARGVDVRVQVNGGYEPDVTYNQQWAKEMTDAPGPGSFSMKWGNSNFNITHQKTVIVDATDTNGKAISEGSLPGSAKIVISTGNFSLDAEYGQKHFYDARNFDMATSEPDLVSTVATTYASDFSCPVSTTITPSGLDPQGRLVWSNGSTGGKSLPKEQYPAFGDYNNDFPSLNQGNSEGAYTAIADAAQKGDVLRLYLLEGKETAIWDSLSAALERGVDLRIIMSQSSLPNAMVTSLVKAGATAHALADDQVFIHAKMLSRNSDALYVGSINASYGSVLWNRELGVNLTSGGDSAGIDTIVSTFDSDWAITGADKVTVYTKDNPPAPPKNDSAEVGPGVEAIPGLVGTGSDPAQPCGDVLAKSGSGSKSGN